MINLNDYAFIIDIIVVVVIMPVKILNQYNNHEISFDLIYF